MARTTRIALPPKHASKKPGGHRRWDQTTTRRTQPIRHRTQPIIDLGDGLIGYGIDPYRTDNCLAAALATAAQVDIAQLPDPRIDERMSAGEDPDEISRDCWERMTSWAHKRGYQLAIHDDELPTDRDRWVGVMSGPGVFNDHCVVMARHRLLFEPGCTVRTPPGLQVKAIYNPLDRITYAITLDPLEAQA